LVTEQDKRIRKVEYTVNENSPYSKKDATVYGQALADICNEEEIDELTPKLVVAHASSPKSPLHAAFTWNDERAANQYRLRQASRLLGAIKVTVMYVDLETKEIVSETRKAYVHLPKGGGRKKAAYHRVDSVLGEPTMLKAAYEQFRSRAQQFMETAKSFKDPELQEMVGDLSKIIGRMNGKFRRR
jgi:hypothetical protein